MTDEPEKPTSNSADEPVGPSESPGPNDPPQPPAQPQGLGYAWAGGTPQQKPLTPHQKLAALTEMNLRMLKAPINNARRAAMGITIEDIDRALHKKAEERPRAKFSRYAKKHR